MNKKYTVYKHTSPNGKVYIGITSQEPEKRWQKGYGYNENQHFFRAIKKYGWDNIQHEIIFNDLSEDEAYKTEMSLIEMYQSDNHEYGYNNCKGGNGSNGLVMPESAKEKLRQINTGRHLSAEARKKLSEKLKGKKFTEEHKQRISNSLKGIKRPGHPLSEETKEKIRVAHKGKKQPHKGVPRSDETRKKISEAQKGRKTFERRVLCIETNTVYKSILMAGKSNHIDPRNISKCLSGERKHSGGFSWVYCDENGKPLINQRRKIQKDCDYKSVSEANSRPVRCLETGEIFISLKEAASKYGVTASAIGHAAKKKTCRSCGLHWEMVKDNDA